MAFLAATSTCKKLLSSAVILVCQKGINHDFESLTPVNEGTSRNGRPGNFPLLGLLHSVLSSCTLEIKDDKIPFARTHKFATKLWEHNTFDTDGNRSIDD